MTAAVLALLGSVLWGAADYVGGVLSRTRTAI
nr:EamA/RhaT family transporter [Geodermatophilaceae bacterium]MBA2417083.1 EamA/RhaT family transporter [Geodermatophilaceae bacterium]